MSGRELPESLTTVLACARDLEAVAEGTHRERPAIAATSALVLAAHQAGWQQLELARHLKMPLATVNKQIASARRDHPDGVSIVVDRPLNRSPSPLSVLRLPVEQREWLTVGEAAEHVDRDRYTDPKLAGPRGAAEHRPHQPRGAPVPTGRPRPGDWRRGKRQIDPISLGCSNRSRVRRCK